MAKETLIHYNIGWNPSGQRPGTKRGLNAGIGDQLRAKVLLRDHPDPRRLDLHASMRDPFERLWVRDFYLNTSLKVIVLLDASASMGYVGTVNRLKVAEEIMVQLAISAYRSGDAFGVFVANDQLIKSAILPPRVNKSACLWVHQQITKVQPFGASAEGLMCAIQKLPQHRSLVFVISDFRWKHNLYRQVLKALSHHDVVPVMLQDPSETCAVPKRGFATIKDMETGRTQFLWMRPALTELIEQTRLLRMQHMTLTSLRYGFKPFIVNGAFKTAQLNQYFLERHG
jgi:uncharacterized protein (DUF58 family)